jgi:deoxyribose-phosphate aldolase
MNKRVLHRPGPTASRFADYIDHTMLSPDATSEDLTRLCDEAVRYRFTAVCVNGSWVPFCSDRLAGSGVKVAAVVGFPLGAATSRAKALEAGELVHLGASELDMVAALGRIHEGDWDYVVDDVRAVVSASQGRAVKVILETATLKPAQIVKASVVCMEAGAQYVKTSTGFHQAGGATVEAVALMREAVGEKSGVKAAGGIRHCETALRMIAAGATRIGTSSGVELAECIGAVPEPFGDLLADPKSHAAVCRMRRDSVRL